ncbi:hypothetical protein SAMN02745157_4838 [Kaistia soli DSM 19436]|uniref:Phage regulatory protein CII (CP76) n=1 Tax=Kaistia soli DSM 19436 TaxID=1122133 RepID=A0A1M5MNQ0_9HYPH|nr:hypothetical protein [Kaistia soli]SHG79020.1 hypothetical protein SAMN02745157_4838 [Kaistia soli DSM 19436]
MNMRTLPRNDYWAIKAATKALVDRCGGPTFVSDEVTRVQKSTVSKYYSTGEEHEGTFIPADAIADLEAHCGEPVITRALAELTGHLLVPIPTGVGTAHWLGHLAGVLNGGAKVEVAFSEALADGSIDLAEAVEVRRLTLAAMERLAALGTALDKVIEGGAA